jgi:galactokinase
MVDLGRLDVMGGIADYSGCTVLQMPIKEGTFVALQVWHKSQVANRNKPVSRTDRVTFYANYGTLNREMDNGNVPFVH